MTEPGYCECGCGERTELAQRDNARRGWVKGQPLRFINHHWSRTGQAKPPVRRGSENNRFNGGLSTYPDGRGLIVCRDGTLMAYYRGVMAAHIGRLLTPDEIVHHINGDPTDDRIENLELTTRSAHINMHRAELVAAKRKAA